MKYKFRAKDLKTDELVEGDLVYAHQKNYGHDASVTIRPMIVTLGCHGGMVWCYTKYYVDENTIELITEE